MDKFLSPQPQAGQNISILQALWNYIKSRRAHIFTGRLFHQTSARAENPLALVKAKQTYLGPGTTSRSLSNKHSALLGMYWERGS